MQAQYSSCCADQMSSSLIMQCVLQSTYNPMQEPSGMYQYTYLPADLMDDADSSMPQHGGTDFEAGPLGMSAPHPSGRENGADERNVLSYVSKEVNSILNAHTCHDHPVSAGLMSLLLAAGCHFNILIGAFLMLAASVHMNEFHNPLSHK